VSAARFLWMATEGVTHALILEEAKRLGLISIVKLTPGEAFTVTAKCGDLKPEDVTRLRDAVYKRLGIADAEAFERERITSSEMYRRWLRDRQKHPPRFHRRAPKGRAA